MTDNIVNRIHKEFIDEAIHSPILMADLANMEKYIAESYSDRSIIELLQNADDAGSCNFLISIIDSEHAIIANDGREFTDEDLYSLCRSGASTKKRKGNTIGFRGIGFKSIVNHSDEVHLVSGNIKTTFSRELTKREVPDISNVPLIRIPHEFSGDNYAQEIGETLRKGYKTVFVFRLYNDGLLREIQEFDDSSLLFLKNVQNITLKSNEYGTSIYHAIRERITSTWKKATIQNVKELSFKDWLVINRQNVSMAFAMGEESLVPAEEDDSVIHSFMPTRTRFCIPCKVNGDFSTDPSRTKVVVDEDTTEACFELSDLFADTVISVIKEGNDKYNFVYILSEIKENPLRNIRPKDANDIFFLDLQAQLKEKLNDANIIIQPDWLIDNGFLEIEDDPNSLRITQSLEQSIPGITAFFVKMGYKELSYEDALEKATKKQYSRETRIELLIEIISKSRFSLPDGIKGKILSAYLFQQGHSTVRLNEVRSGILDEDFVNELLSRLPNQDDFYWFIKRLGLEKMVPFVASDQVESDDAFSNNGFDQIEEKSGSEHNVRSKSIANIDRNKTLIENVREFLKARADIALVKDVSLMELGYNTEVTTTAGRKLYVEIKEVQDAASFTMSSSEYLVAKQNIGKYLLIVGCMRPRTLHMLFIANPTEVLDLDRRIISWEWICNEYSGTEYSVPYVN